MAKFDFLLIFGTCLILTAAVANAGGKGGGGKKKPMPLTARKAPDDKIKTLVTQLEPEIREKICAIGAQVCSEEGDPIVVQAYKKQVVTGTNYFASVTMKDKWYHIRIFEQTWTDTLEVVDVIGPKSKTDEIRYF